MLRLVCEAALLVAPLSLVAHSFTPLSVCVLLSCLFFLVTLRLIPSVTDVFVAAKMCGRDLSKTTSNPIPEPMGVVVAAAYLVCMFLFLPFPFYYSWYLQSASTLLHEKFAEFICALLCICCMIFLGFADDVFNLRWRVKLFLPTVASLPLLMVYFVTFHSTTIIVPLPLRPLLGLSVDLGVLYYVYMGCLAVFCTNAINILAGVNGLESGQSLVIGVSILINSWYNLGTSQHDCHLFSLYFIIPFVAVCAALTYYNWYPASVFVGDTFCYFAGMTFAVVGILGHFSKTMLLFFIPQVANFLFSCPQLFKFVPCPRHRMPKFDPVKNQLGMSYAAFRPDELSFTSRALVWFFRAFGLAHVRKTSEAGVVEMSNLTIINFVLKVCGPMHERTLTIVLLSIQGACSLFAFWVRYTLVKYFYVD